jgi:hypothetical protein
MVKLLKFMLMSQFSGCYEIDQLSVILKLLGYIYITETEVTFPERSGKCCQM